MLQTKKVAFSGSTYSRVKHSPYPLSLPLFVQRGTYVIAAAGPFQLNNLFDAFRRKAAPKLSQTLSKPESGNEAVKEERRLRLPPTFQRLGPELCCLVDPKNDRLVYLLGVDEGSSADAVSSKLRALLRAAAAPYVHLTGLPDGLRTSLLREFPGGHPILTDVPLPPDVTKGLQRQHEQLQQQDGFRQLPEESPAEDNLDPTQRPDSQRLWAPGGVLELLYGNGQPTGPDASGTTSAAAAAGTAAPAAGSGADTLRDMNHSHRRDLPDELLSRRKQMKSLMRWRKGASSRVARRRGERGEGKFDWLTEALNTFSMLSVVPVTPNVVLIRNNVNDSFAVDVPTGGDGDPNELLVMVAGSDGASGLMEILQMISDEDEDEDDSDDEGGDVDEDEDEDDDAVMWQVVEDDSDDEDGGDSDDKDGDDDDDDDDDDEDTPAWVRRLFATLEDGESSQADTAPKRVLLRGNSVEQESRKVLTRGGADQEQQEDEERDTERTADSADIIIIPPGSDGSVRNYSGNDDRGEEDDDEGDDSKVVMEWEGGEVLDVQLSPGPMGWTALLQLGREADGGRRPGDGADRKTASDFQAHLEYLRDMGRLEALWAQEQQAEDGTQLPPPPAVQPPPQAGQGEAGGAQGPHQGLEDAASSLPSAQGAEAGPSVGGNAGVPSGLEADWRRADGRAAAAARARGAAARRRPPPAPMLPPAGSLTSAAATGAVPTDHLMRPPRRPATPPGAAASTSAASAAGEDAGVGAASSDGGHGKEQTCTRAGADSTETAPVPAVTGDDLLAARRARFLAKLRADAQAGGEGQNNIHGLSSKQGTGAAAGGAESAPVPAVAADDFAASTKMPRARFMAKLRAGGDASGTGQDSGVSESPSPAPLSGAAEGEPVAGPTSDSSVDGSVVPLRPTGRSRMVRRPRGPVSPGASEQRVNEGGPAQAGDGFPVGAAAHGPSAASAAPKSSAGADASSGVVARAPEGDFPIPAYRHMRHAAGGTGAGAGADGAGAGAGVPVNALPPWGRAPHPASSSAPKGLGRVGLPPEEAGYAALDLDQLAQFVLGRQASPEEVQDLARAVALSEEVEVAVGDLGRPPPQPQGSAVRHGHSRHQSGHPHHQHQQHQHQHQNVADKVQRSEKQPHRQENRQENQLAEPWKATSGAAVAPVEYRVRSGRRGERRRLRIPDRVLQLAAKHWPSEAVPSDGAAENESSEAGGAARRAASVRSSMPVHRGGTMPPRLTLRRRGTGNSVEAGAEPQRPGAQQGPTLAQRTEQQRQTDAMVQALSSAPSLERRAAAALIAFLRGREPPQEVEEQQRRQPEADPQMFGSPTLHRRGRGLSGLVPGRDAVVVLPRRLLETATGAWQQQEQMLMHEDYRVGR